MENKSGAAAKLNKKALSAILKYKYPLAIALAGIIFLTLPYKSNDSPQPDSGQTSAPAYDIRELESRLSEMLSKCDGVGKSEVLLTHNGSVETVYEKNTESNMSRGGADDSAEYQRQEQSELATLQNSSYNQDPVIIKYNYPAITGALVVCEGGAADNVRLRVIQAIGAVTGLGSESISVIKMKTN